ncbi:MAG: MOSC domain-containing protein [Caldilineaceae bacterium]
MQLISVNRGDVQPLANAKAHGVTGIFKQPLAGPVLITTMGIPEDAICDTENHGGVDQAIYLYGEPDYQWWEQELRQPLAPGTFGENLTIADLESGNFAVGDRFQIGDCILEVTAPRIPCVTLARRMGDPTFAKRFRAAERPGLYGRVFQEGKVCSGDPVHYTPYAGDRIGVIEMFRNFFAGDRSETTLRRYLAAPIAIRDRQEKERLLAELLK